MNRRNRAAAVAVASAALVAGVSFSAPSQAEDRHFAIAAQPQPVLNTPAGIDAALDNAVVQVAPPAVSAGPETNSFFGSLWTKATSLLGLGTPAPVAPPPPTLDELVAAYAGEQTANDEQDCLAKAVYFEARGEPIEGQLAVAQVVMNRAASGRYPTSFCDVITQPWQFSFIRRGKFPTPDFSSEAWRKAVAVSRIAEAKLAGTLPSDVLWYHATYVAPSWGKRLHRTAQIGLHIFYS